MRKKRWSFFGGMLSLQEKWLNRMADSGWRLVRVGKLLYEFEECGTERFCYCVEFIGQKRKERAVEYHDFLEGMGYRVFYKNANLNYSIGKLRFRPWAEKGGRIAANTTTFGRELLIVEKESDGNPFRLHTTYEDRQAYCRILQKPYLSMFLIFSLSGILMRQWLWGVFAIPFLVPALLYQRELIWLKKQAGTKEQ